MTHGPEPAVDVRRPVMRMRWQTLTFLHWRYAAAEVQALLPAGLRVDTYEGDAWVGLVPFFMHVRAPAGPSIPWLSRFPETNVRTYVTDRAGRQGIWFFSLDATRMPAVLTARGSYGLPYFWSRMAVQQSGAEVHYTSARRWPGPVGARCNLTVQPGEAYEPVELSELDHWLTARWRLFSTGVPVASRLGGGLSYAEAHHRPWPLHRATVRDLDESVIAASGLAAPAGEPLVHYSPGVDVRIGLPQR